MAKQDITLIETSDTFQLWLDKTNELVDLMNTDVLTASIVGDITVGNATLTGDFTATNLISTTSITDSFSVLSVVHRTNPVNFIDFKSPISIASTQEKLLELKSSTQKPAINLINKGNANWKLSLATAEAPSDFVIQTDGVLVPQLSLSQAGDLTILRSLTLGGSLTLTGTASQLVGNASTATKFFTPRNINGVAFDGSQAITITANTTNTLTRGTYLTGDNFNGSAARTWAVDATTTNTAGKVVARDAAGDFAAGTITATLSGNASSATTLVGLTSSIAELNFSNGVTANIQTQLNGITTNVTTLQTSKANVASPTFTGTPSAPTATAATNNTQIATTAFVRTAVSSGVGSIVIPDPPPPFPAGSSAGNGISISTTGTIAMTGSYPGAFSTTGPNGSITASQNVTAYSDERLKSNIRTIDNALDKVSHMRGVYFDKDNEASTGVIAQEIEKVLPEVVFDGEYKSVAYGNIVGILIEAIKELKTEIEELKRTR